MKWRKINRILHRDLGFFFFGMTIIYALSGIALNHIEDWNPSYIIHTDEFKVDGIPEDQSEIDKNYILQLVENHDQKENFKNYYFSGPNTLKIFIDNGNIEIDIENGEGKIEKTKRRPIFYEVNYLHYNPQKWWTWFSDIYAFGLIIIAVTGLFIIRGQKGITGRGAWLTIIGILIPILFLIFYG
ncbi:MAG: PepSY-associated TM helix domain-containing protein [Bacteroidales bacterium]